MLRNASEAEVLRGKICLGILPVLIGSLMFLGCDDPPEDDDPPEIDSGIIDDNDASIIENDAGSGDETLEFIRIPAGSFTLSHNTGSGIHSSGDTITLEAFALKKTPVTVAEFERCVAAGACTSDHYYAGSPSSFCNYNRDYEDEDEDEDDRVPLSWKNHPMNCIDWFGAKQYCAWIGGRLPTEEEWEYASTHNGTTHLDTTYPWGNDAPTHCVTAQYNDEWKFCLGYAAAAAPGSRRWGTSDVSLHSPAGDSPLGLVDMSGNVLEWTSSLYGTNSSLSIRDHYVLKGASWYGSEIDLSVTNYSYDNHLALKPNYGFRCAK
jgi:Uncharacterized conserved protein